MSTNKITPAMRRVLRGIQSGSRWNATQNTLNAIVDAHLAAYVYGTVSIPGRWVILPAGQRLLDNGEA